MLKRSPYNTPEVRELVRKNILPLVDVEIGEFPLNLSEKGHMDFIAEKAMEFGAELIVIDNTSAGFELESDNNNSEVAKKIMLPLRGLAKKTGAAVILVHHTPKPGEGARNSVDVYMGRGASNFANLCRSGYALVLNEKAGEGWVVLHNTKNKSGPKGEPVMMRLDFKTLWFEVVGDVAKQDLTAERIRDYVERCGEATVGQIQAHFQSLGFPETTTRRRTIDADKNGLITRKNQRAPYKVVEAQTSGLSQAA